MCVYIYIDSYVCVFVCLYIYSAKSLLSSA